MKKVLLISLIALLAGACKDYLEVDHLLEYTLDIEGVFESRDYSDQWLAGVYSHLTGGNMDVCSKGQAPFTMISDDMYFNDRRKANDNGRTYEKFKNGEYTETDEQGSWASSYQGIRDASTYMLHIDKCKEITEKEGEGAIVDRKAQARFLRAYYYWLLLRKYGPIPILPNEGLDFMDSYEELSLPRNTYEECAEYIASELALAAKDLNPMRDNRNVARPTRGAALAARAKVYLYSASPLFNGNTSPWAAQLVDSEGKRLISEQRSDLKWAKAAAAAKDVIDLGIYRLYTVARRETASGNQKGYNQWMNFDFYRYPATINPPFTIDDPEFEDIDPFESYRQVFNGAVSASANPELIFTRGVNQTDNENIGALAHHQMPYSLGGWNTHGLSLKMYDAYYMRDGSDFPSDSRPTGYTDTISGSPNHYANYPPLPPKVSLQHANREPRFYASVAYNGSIWEGHGNPDLNATNARYKQVFYYRDSEDGKVPGESQYYLPTGIGIKKYCHPDDYTASKALVTSYQKPEPAIRYAEMLLIYAEALNELEGAHSIPSYDGSQTITVTRNANEMRKGIKPVRLRAGLPDFEYTVYNDRDKFREKLKRERQIELMGEGHRYFDLRRWMDAPKEEGAPVWGFNMNMPSSQREIFDTPIEILSMPSVFVEKMYLWPISHTELRRNRKLTQNPGWTYFTE
jgi:hypothetical protein